jgi:hypothetical protein
MVAHSWADRNRLRCEVAGTGRPAQTRLGHGPLDSGPADRAGGQADRLHSRRGRGGSQPGLRASRGAGTTMATWLPASEPIAAGRGHLICWTFAGILTRSLVAFMP